MFSFGSVNELTKLTVAQCPILRDSKNKFKPLERHFCNLSSGFVFGESILLGRQEKNRFFNAIAMSNCKLLRISRIDFNYMLTLQDRKVFNEKIEFLRSLPEFKNLSL